MSSRIGPGIISENLVLALDANNVKSYPGEPTTNLLLHSEDFSTSWTGNLFSNWINATVTTNAAIAPNGTLTADKLTNKYSRFQRISISPSTTYIFSLWVKNVDITVAPRLHIATGLNGTLVTNYAATTGIPLANIVDWTRFTCTCTTAASGVNQMEVGFEFLEKNVDKSVYVWGAQCEQKAHSTPYIQTVGSTVTRSATDGFKDLSGNGNHGQLDNMTYDSNAEMNFDGASGTKITISDSSILKPTELTFEAWIKANSIGGAWINVFGKDTYTESYLIFLESTTHAIRALHRVDGSENRCNTDELLSTSVFKHVVFTFKTGDYIRSYFNSVPSTTKSLAAGSLSYTGSNDFMIGGQGTDWFDGIIDKIQIYSRILTPTEIIYNFNAFRAHYGI